ncbi:ERF family protein [Saccharopolyspora sp. NPDC000359]|uniref:ERF family protein n=1 Tax=Saccharopolyspora sp. NPDC000359 TaxID=3154251 RepID=UPI0033297212
MNVHEAITAVMEDVRAIEKGDRNDFHNFAFRGIDRVLNRVGPALRVHGLVVTPELRSLDSRDITTSKGKKEREVTVTVAYHFRGPEGDVLDPPVVVPGEASDSGDKAVAKAMSVAQRTAYIQAFNIPTGETDPDQHNITRAVDPLVKVKTEIWAEAEKRGWITGDGYQKLAEDFTAWSNGSDITEADEKPLRDYLAHIRPKRTMRRSNGGQQS